MGLVGARFGSPRRARSLAVAVATASIVTAASASQGAYFSQSWGWVALGFLVPTTVLALLERTTAPGRLRVAFVAAVGALAVWIALSALWSVSPSGTVREVERMLVYVAVALALAFVARRGDEAAVLSGALAGIALVTGYALATRCTPIASTRSPTRTFRTGSRSRSGTGTRSGCSQRWGSSLHLASPRTRDGW